MLTCSNIKQDLNPVIFHAAVENTCSEYHTWKLWRGKTLVNVLNQLEGKILANDLHV